MRVLVLAVALFTVAILAAPDHGDAHFKRGRHNTLHAINYAFCHHSYRPCARGREATQVARCETGGTFSVHAHNGQFLGLFQMGSSERARFGHGVDPWKQSLAAWRYYAVSGWSPWQCTPWGGLRW